MSGHPYRDLTCRAERCFYKEMPVQSLVYDAFGIKEVDFGTLTWLNSEKTHQLTASRSKN